MQFKSSIVELKNFMSPIFCLVQNTFILKAKLGSRRLKSNGVLIKQAYKITQQKLNVRTIIYDILMLRQVT